jgi:hypothetical protein
MRRRVSTNTSRPITPRQAFEPQAHHTGRDDAPGAIGPRIARRRLGGRFVARLAHFLSLPWAKLSMRKSAPSSKSSQEGLRSPESGSKSFGPLWGRRGGKSRAIAVLCVFVAVFVDHSAVLVVGERPVVLCLAPSQKQANVVYSYIAGIFESTPMLAKLVASKTAEILALTNGIEIEIRSASFRNVRGCTAVAVVGDEAAFWFDESSGSSNPDTAILDALRPALATTGGLLAVISSPYARRGALYETWARHYGEKGDRRILVAQGASRDLNPSLPQSVVDRALERDPASASAEYLASFRADIESFVRRDVVEACVTPGRYELPPISGVNYYGFCDPSGGSQDSMTLAIAHREAKGPAVLDAVRERRPPFSPEGVTSEFALLLKTYRIRNVYGDRYAGEWPRERFRAHQIDYKLAEKTKSEIYRDALPGLNSGKFELLDHPRLVAQICGLERRTARGGRDSIDHPPGQHDDIANSVLAALSLVGTGQLVLRISPEALRMAEMATAF